jgi:hypothetical protein
MDYNRWREERKRWHRLTPRQQAAAVEAELDRPLTQAEIADWHHEILVDAGIIDEEQVKPKPSHLRLVIDNDGSN